MNPDIGNAVLAIVDWLSPARSGRWRSRKSLPPNDKPQQKNRLRYAPKFNMMTVI